LCCLLKPWAWLYYFAIIFPGEVPNTPVVSTTALVKCDLETRIKIWSGVAEDKVDSDTESSGDVTEDEDDDKTEFPEYTSHWIVESRARV